MAVILPARNNLPYVHRATRHMLWELLERGVHVYYQPAPFVHSKLFYVDDDYAQIGSANFDSRSLRLNFEMNVEVYDRDTVTGLATALRSDSRAVSAPSRWPTSTAGPLSRGRSTASPGCSRRTCRCAAGCRTPLSPADVSIRVASWQTLAGAT